MSFVIRGTPKGEGCSPPSQIAILKTHILYTRLYKKFYVTCPSAERLRWSRGSVLAFGTQVRRVQTLRKGKGK